LVVHPCSKGKFRLVDGHVRFELLVQAGITAVPCLIAKEDEGHTYNNKVNRLPAIAEHYMLLKAVKHGVTESSIASALGFDVDTIRRRRDLLNGICNEASELLKDKHVAIAAFPVLRKMKPIRQVEAAEFMIASNNYSRVCAQALVTRTRPSLLVAPEKERRTGPIPSGKKIKLEEETDNLLKQVKALEKSYGTDILHLTLVCGYFRKLLGNANIQRHLSKRYPEMLEEIQGILAALETAKRRTKAGPTTKAITARLKRRIARKRVKSSSPRDHPPASVAADRRHRG
jgi:ParB-like chromosome segregation protein Spo0J